MRLSESRFKDSLFRLGTLTLILLFFVPVGVYSQPAAHKNIIYAGSFSKMGEPGLYVFSFDRQRKELTKIQTVGDGASPNFLAVHPNKQFLYAIYDQTVSSKNREGAVVSYKINSATGGLSRLNEQPANGTGPAHLSVDPKGRFVYVANYGSGSLAVYPILSNGELGNATDVIQDTGSGPHLNQRGPHVHCAIPSPDGRFLYVCDLGIDKIFTYEVQQSGKLLPAKVPFFATESGGGPRQFAISPDGEHAFAVLELVSRLLTFRRDKQDGSLTLLQTLEMLPHEQKSRGSDATVFVTPNGKTVLATNWGPKGLASYQLDRKTGMLTLADESGADIKQPRDIEIDQKGDFVFVANMWPGTLSLFSINKKTGKLTFEHELAKVPAIACIQQVMLR